MKWQLLVNTDAKNYTKIKWDHKSFINLQVRKNCDLFKKGTEPGPSAVHSAAKALASGTLGLMILINSIF
tara:strand:- start:58 stop:267 length:210 start_codon:yes stop_codon:yes gene_type:complete